MQGLHILLFIFLLGLGSIWSSPSEAFEIDPRQPIPRGEARWRYLRPRWGRQPGKFEGVGILPSPLYTDPAIRACWAPFRPIPGCSFSLLHSSRSSKIDINADCCNAVLRLTPDCFYKIFHTILFKGSFGPSVETHCASKPYKGNAPATAPAVK